LLLHRLHFTFLSTIFIELARILVLHLLQTKTFLNNLACAAGIFAILINYQIFNSQEMILHFLDFKVRMDFKYLTSCSLSL